ncbi:thiamine pyrophosphate-binding protein [Propylenella binzhouense]|uniref:Thiamine pyrophosphate-binding protein n=1 Tax=Propylenella binzhouense TaxID=2555902 RepID=A0A964WTQ1_9HYPH|nr:thiamine pyrophosphate-binding protein [Propylenella binzhouense]MYZ48216.1 thiamine pyrophosphate-binding protein [Propylenella binzhouense]
MNYAVSVPSGVALEELPTYVHLARAFAREGVEVNFTLMGDGNMHWATALAEQPGVRTYHVRHEHCALAMAMGYSIASGKVGVASVTCGPGLTQLSTALATAAQARVPVVVFSGDTPINASFYNQRIDQGPVVTATGAHHIACTSMKRMLEFVREAFYVARTERRPVVLSVPYDMQKQKLPAPHDYVPSTDYVPDTGPVAPHPAYVEKAVDAIASARRVVVIAGRGVLRSGAQSQCEELADLCGGMLATTLPERGMFDHHPFGIGIAGGFSRDIGKELFAQADLVVAVGASLHHFTVDGGTLFPQARVLQIDAHPVGLKNGRKVADLFLEADAKLGLGAVIAGLKERGIAPSDWRTPELARRIAEEPADSTEFEIEPATLDPREAVLALDRVIPKDWEIVSGSGHCSYFHAQMRGRRPEHFHTIREFGAIGNGLCYAIGVAVARPDSQVVLIDGDGGFMMHAQELETARRHGLKLLLCILNDGAFGSEIHKLRADGLDDSGAIFGRGDLGRIAEGFGLRGSVVTDVGQIEALIEPFKAADVAELWDIHISDRVTSPTMRKAHPKKH